VHLRINGAFLGWYPDMWAVRQAARVLPAIAMTGVSSGRTGGILRTFPAEALLSMRTSIGVGPAGKVGAANPGVFDSYSPFYLRSERPVP